MFGRRIFLQKRTSSFRVVFCNDAWQLRADDAGTKAEYPTLQQAVAAGKAAAWDGRTTLAWFDRDGRLQGSVDYSISPNGDPPWVGDGAVTQGLRRSRPDWIGRLASMPGGTTTAD